MKKFYAWNNFNLIWLGVNTWNGPSTILKYQDWSSTNNSTKLGPWLCNWYIIWYFDQTLSSLRVILENHITSTISFIVHWFKGKNPMFSDQNLTLMNTLALPHDPPLGFIISLSIWPTPWYISSQALFSSLRGVVGGEETWEGPFGTLGYHFLTWCSDQSSYLPVPVWIGTIVTAPNLSAFRTGEKHSEHNRDFHFQ